MLLLKYLCSSSNKIKHTCTLFKTINNFELFNTVDSKPLEHISRRLLPSEKAVGGADPITVETTGWLTQWGTTARTTHVRQHSLRADNHPQPALGRGACAKCAQIVSYLLITNVKIKKFSTLVLKQHIRHDLNFFRRLTSPHNWK